MKPHRQNQKIMKRSNIIQLERLMSEGWMVISLSGYDGMGKSTSVDLLMEKICENHGLKGMSALKANNGTEVYENIEQVDDIYKALSRYDVITTRFYFRSNKMQKLQEMVMFAETPCR